MLSLWNLSLAYFFCYSLTGVFVKYFTGKPELGFLGQNSMEYLVYSTSFSSVFCVGVVLALGWPKRGRLSSAEWLQLGASGLCTAYIIPATTLIYSLPVTVMIAMVLMRGSVIVASRLVDFALQLEGLQKKSVTWQEELAVLFAIGAVATKLFYSSASGPGFPFLGILLLSCYFCAYLVRLYIMNRSKLLGIAGKALDQKLFFSTEQLFASAFMLLVSAPLYFLHRGSDGSEAPLATSFVRAIESPHPQWILASLSGLPYAFIAFLSVFLFLYPGKSATFTGVLNRLVSLMGGTASSLAIAALFSGPLPPNEDWAALSLICVAIGFLAWGDHSRRRASRAG